MPMLLIDGTALDRAGKGVGRYTYHLCLQMTQRLPAGWDIVIARFPGALPQFPEQFPADWVTLPYASDLRRGLCLMPGLVRRLRPDVLLRPMDSAGRGYGVPTITVCHDIPSLIRRAARRRSGPWRSLVDKVNEGFRAYAMRLSDIVVCNSEFVRDAVARHYGIDRDRTILGYCGVDPGFYPMSENVRPDEVRRKYGVSRYILTFATGDLREGFEALPAVLREVRIRGVETCLIVAGTTGGSAYVNDLRLRFAESGLAEGRDFKFEDFLGEGRMADLAALYSAADFYLELSRHEGFGMQLAEAMACGTTCISSMAGALREVAGGYAIPVDPDDPAGVAEAIAGAYRQGGHTRDNRDQVEYTRRFDWGAVGRVVAESVVRMGR